jgi:hypothetical protein
LDGIFFPFQRGDFFSYLRLNEAGQTTSFNTLTAGGDTGSGLARLSLNTDP